MINFTIVYSTRQNDPQFVRHLQQTCGLKKVEILAYTNPGDKSLSAVYNHALSTAKQDFIVFIHDDVIFESNNWGRNVIQHLQHSEYGILGIAGTANLSKSGIWWENALTTIGIVKHQCEKKTWTTKYSGNFKERIIPVVCVDGVFMAVNRQKLRENFNERLTDFHFYDIDFCIAHFIADVKIGVIFNVPLIHKSIGQTNDIWEQQRTQFLTTHKYNLPCTLKPSLIFDNKSLKIKNAPKISIVILHKSKNFLLFNCLNSFAEKSSYSNYEIIVADTGSSKEELEEIYELVNTTKMNLKVVEFDNYHFARTNNEVVLNHTDANSELILFCNNDIELINDALIRMVQVYLQNKKACGTIGCRLHFADNTIQHGGIQLAMNQGKLEIGHTGFRSYYHFEPDEVEKDIIGSTAAFLLMSKALFKKVGGFNPAYQKCLEDVELNLNCIKHHKKNYFVSNAVCYHFESQTRQEKSAITRNDYEMLLQFLVKNQESVEKYVLKK
ncbi:glycosyltransferase [Candidatus Parabeggiatoa sp. HSG14]|uniref:glycosyltransferase n=1 Tax=Candidatus Parabeggiatoa sp. HSG14 TaxID=3055593 RepID=UPI0025A72872|nr:glycosyltransferase [Thiotrichales bacterium HSG14]